MNLNFLAMSCRNYLTQGHIISFLCYIDPSKPNIFHKFVLTNTPLIWKLFWKSMIFAFFKATCHPQPNPKYLTWIAGSTSMCIPQLFSLMLHKNASDKFSFESCKFTIQRSKESTGRFVKSWILMMILRMLIIISKLPLIVVGILLNISSIQGGLLEHGNHELVHSWGALMIPFSFPFSFLHWSM